jgi:hypothetical protein
VIAGITVPSAQQKSLTMGFLRLKKEFEPQLRSSDKQLSDLITFEVKGSRLRKDIARTDRGRKTRRRALGFIDKTIRLLEAHSCRIIGKVLVKVDGRILADKKEYPKAVQELAVSFNSQASVDRTDAIMILDSRTKVKNEGNVHAITTRRFRSGGDVYPQMSEAPLFGHSDTHVPLQIADLLASAVVFPLACLAFTSDDPANVHRHANYQSIKDQFGERLARLEHRYVHDSGAVRGGFQVVDPVQKRPTHLLFRD